MKVANTLSNWSPITIKNVMQQPKLYTAIQIPHKNNELGPHSPAKVLCISTVFVTSLQFASIIMVEAIKIKKKSWAIIAVAKPPDLSNASGKFSKPAPSVALTIKNMVPIDPTPEKHKQKTIKLKNC